MGYEHRCHWGHSLEDDSKDLYKYINKDGRILRNCRACRRRRLANNNR